MWYLLSLLVTIISLYSHPTISTSYNVGSNYYLSTDTVYAIYNPHLRQYMEFDGKDIRFVDGILNNPNTKWKIEIQHWGSFALKSVGTGEYITYNNHDWTLQSTASAYYEWYMGFDAEYHGNGDVKDFPTVHVWTMDPTHSGTRWRMESFTTHSMEAVSALCDTSTATLQSYAFRLAGVIDKSCGTLNQAKFVFIPEHHFDNIIGYWQILHSCFECESSEYEYSVGVTGLTQTDISSSWSNSLSKEVSAGFSVKGIGASGGVTSESSSEISNSMSTAFEQTASSTSTFECKKDNLYQWTISATSNSQFISTGNIPFQVTGPQLVCIDSPYTPKCLPNKCADTNCQECHD